MKQAWLWVVCCTAFGLGYMCWAGLQSSTEYQSLTIQDVALTVEVVRSKEDIQKGLMHRRSMPCNNGMLFVFPDEAIRSFWMKNTYIPLSVAFINSQGIILNITDMEPLSERNHLSAGPARYVLEVNQGWFTRNVIKAGDRVEGL